MGRSVGEQDQALLTSVRIGTPRSSVVRSIKSCSSGVGRGRRPSSLGGSLPEQPLPPRGADRATHAGRHMCPCDRFHPAVTGAGACHVVRSVCTLPDDPGFPVCAGCLIGQLEAGIAIRAGCWGHRLAENGFHERLPLDSVWSVGRTDLDVGRGHRLRSTADRGREARHRACSRRRHRV
jgi:hypothetical protein